MQKKAPAHKYLLLALALFCASTQHAQARCSTRTERLSVEQLTASGAVLFQFDDCSTKKPNYLFGTVHTDSERGEQVAKFVLKTVLNKIDAVGFEYIPPENAEELTASLMYVPASKRSEIRRVLDPKQYIRLTDILFENQMMEPAVVDRLTPWAAAVLLQIPKTKNDGVIVDDKIKVAVAEAGKEQFGLETLEDQLAVFDKMPEKQQISLLTETLADYEGVMHLNELLKKAFEQQDLQSIAELGDQSFDHLKDPLLRTYIRNALLINRNYDMARVIKKKTFFKPSLVVVGALHLTGEKGLFALLHKAGYRIVPIKGTLPEEKKEDKKDAAKEDAAATATAPQTH